MEFKVSFTLEQVQALLLELLIPGNKDVLEIVISRDGNIPQVPETRVKFMQTAGGMQFGVKPVSFQGEGSGAYFPPTSVQECAQHILGMSKMAASSILRLEYFRAKFRGASSHSASRELVILKRQEAYMPNHEPFAAPEWLENCETVELRLPEYDAEQKALTFSQSEVSAFFAQDVANGQRLGQRIHEYFKLDKLKASLSKAWTAQADSQEQATA